jgi:hypothetical protein
MIYSRAVASDGSEQRSTGTKSGLAIIAVEDDSLLDQLLEQWGSLMGVILWQERLPEQVRGDWRQRLVDMSFLDPQVPSHLEELGAEMQHWQHRLTCDVAQLWERLRSIAELCIAYRRFTLATAVRGSRSAGAAQADLCAVTW